MKFALTTAVALSSIFTLANAANAYEVRDCDRANVGLTSLVVPASEHSRTYAKGKISAYEIDQIEPACCSLGVAFVLPDVDSELGDSKCIAITGLSGVDLMKAKSSYDANRGLLLQIPIGRYNPDDGRTYPIAPLKVRINLKRSTVVVED